MALFQFCSLNLHIKQIYKYTYASPTKRRVKIVSEGCSEVEYYNTNTHTCTKPENCNPLGGRIMYSFSSCSQFPSCSKGIVYEFCNLG